MLLLLIATSRLVQDGCPEGYGARETVGHCLVDGGIQNDDNICLFVLYSRGLMEDLQVESLEREAPTACMSIGAFKVACFVNVDVIVLVVVDVVVAIIGAVMTGTITTMNHADPTIDRATAMAVIPISTALVGQDGHIMATPNIIGEMLSNLCQGRFYSVNDIMGNR